MGVILNCNHCNAERAGAPVTGIKTMANFTCLTPNISEASKYKIEIERLTVRLMGCLSVQGDSKKIQKAMDDLEGIQSILASMEIPKSA